MTIAPVRGEVARRDLESADHREHQVVLGKLQRGGVGDTVKRAIPMDKFAAYRNAGALIRWRPAAYQRI